MKVKNSGSALLEESLVTLILWMMTENTPNLYGSLTYTRYGFKRLIDSWYTRLLRQISFFLLIQVLQFTLNKINHVERLLIVHSQKNASLSKSSVEVFSHPYHRPTCQDKKQFVYKEIEYSCRYPKVAAPYPFLRSDLYSAEQPALFILDALYTGLKYILSCSILFIYRFSSF